MPQFGLAQLEAVLTQIEGEEVVPQFQQKAIFFNRIMANTNAEWVNGKGYKINMYMTQEASNAYVSEGGSNPPGGQPEYIDGYVNIVRYRKTGDITSDVYQDLQRGDRSARLKFADYIGQLNTSAIREMEEALMGDGRGLKAVVSGGTASPGAFTFSTTPTATWGATKGSQFLIPNGIYDLYDINGNLRQAAIQLATVTVGSSPAATTVAPLSVTPASTDILVYQDSYNKVLRGLSYFVNNDNGPFQMVLRANYNKLKSPVEDLAGAMIVVSTITKIKRKVRFRSSADTPNRMTIATGYSQAEAYERLGYGLRRFGAQDKKFDGSFDEIGHGDSEWLPTPVMDEDRLYFLYMKDFGRIEKRAFGFITEDSLKIRQKQGKWGTGANGWYFNLGWDGNFYIQSPKEHGLVKRAGTNDLATEASSW
jgi:hypothetical protein